MVRYQPKVAVMYHRQIVELADTEGTLIILYTHTAYCYLQFHLPDPQKNIKQRIILPGGCQVIKSIKVVHSMHVAKAKKICRQKYLK